MPEERALPATHLGDVMTSNALRYLSAVLILLSGTAANTALAQGRGDEGRGRGREGTPARIPQEEQQQRIDEQRQRDDQYRQALARQIQAAQEQRAQLEAQHRAAQIAQHDAYLRSLQQQQARLPTSRNYDQDEYYSAPATVRYRLGGFYRETNQYGEQVLRQAVSYGYQQGYYAGRADRQDGAPANYARLFAYQDANYGYNGLYVPQGDYNSFFRQGFVRGYQDGYGSAMRYGTFSNGSASILSNILSSILGFVPIR